MKSIKIDDEVLAELKACAGHSYSDKIRRLIKAEDALESHQYDPNPKKFEVEWSDPRMGEMLEKLHNIELMLRYK